MAAAALLNRSILPKFPATATSMAPPAAGMEHPAIHKLLPFRAVTNVTRIMRWLVVADTPARCGRARWPASPAAARADDSSAPFEMSVENALKLLGVQEGASFDEVLRAKNAIIASCKDDQEAMAQVEAAYDMLLMKSLIQRRSGKVANSNIRYADVKQARSSRPSGLPQWLKLAVNNAPISVESPSTSNLGIQAGVYGALMVIMFVSGASMDSVGTNTGADVPGFILAISFGASIYFLRKKSIKLGKATLMTAGGLVVGAVVGSAVENWLQVDIVPFMGIHSPAVIVSEFILFSQLLVSLFLS